MRRSGTGFFKQLAHYFLIFLLCSTLNAAPLEDNRKVLLFIGQDFASVGEYRLIFPHSQNETSYSDIERYNLNPAGLLGRADWGGWKYKSFGIKRKI